MEEKNVKHGYNIFDCKTGQSIGVAKSRKAAQRKADHLDSEYGAVRYTVRLVDDAYMASLKAAKAAKA